MRKLAQVRFGLAFFTVLGLQATVACTSEGGATQAPTADASGVLADSAEQRDGGGLSQDAHQVRPVADAQVAADAAVSPPDFSSPLISNKVAAVQYGQGQASLVDASCSQAEIPDVCALESMSRDARRQGAAIIVLPEYAIDQQYYEPTPTLGDNPATNSAWPADLIIKQMSEQARALGSFILFDLLTYTGQEPNVAHHNTQIALSPAGEVVGVHHKFNLFGNESSALVAGNDVAVFNTPLGPMGQLICADIYGDSTLLDRLASMAKVVAVSSYWTVDGAVSWYRTYAQRFKVYTIVSNHTHSKGYGGGIYRPDGTPIVEVTQTTPTILYAELPLP